MRIKNRKLLDTYQGIKCLVCSHTETTVAHHIKTKGAGGDDAPYNLVPLCYVHHAEIHKSLSDFAEKYPLMLDFLKENGWEKNPVSNRWYRLKNN